MSPDRRRPATERGTSTLEVAGLVPVLLIVAFALIHGGFALYGISAAQTAARQAARADSLGQDATRAAERALPGWLSAEVETFGPGSGVRVRVDLPDVIPGTDLVVTRTAELP